MSSGRGRKVRQELPIDIVEDILLRLPAEHVLQCKLLSNTYYNLVRNQDFINRHLLHQQQSRGNINVAVLVWIHDLNCLKLKLLQPNASKSYNYKLPGYTVRQSNYIEVVGSCNGLLCVFSYMGSKTRSFNLWNPATGEYIQIPSPNPSIPERCYPEPDVLGFGYGARSCGDGGDYKLLKIGKYNSSDSFSAMVWSMKTSRWKEIGYVLPGRLVRPECRFRSMNRALCIRGILYCLAWNTSRPILFSFNMTNDTFKEVTMPDDCLLREEGYNLLILTDFMGSLALLKKFPASSKDSDMYNVWVMDDENCSSSNSNSSWTKKFTIGPIGRHVTPTRASMNGNFVMRDSSAYGMFILYDPRCNKKLELDTADPRERYYVRGDPWCFTSSLVSVKQTPQTTSTRSEEKREGNLEETTVWQCNFKVQ